MIELGDMDDDDLEVGGTPPKQQPTQQTMVVTNPQANPLLNLQQSNVTDTGKRTLTFGDQSCDAVEEKSIEDSKRIRKPKANAFKFSFAQSNSSGSFDDKQYISNTQQLGRTNQQKYQPKEQYKEVVIEEMEEGDVHEQQNHFRRTFGRSDSAKFGEEKIEEKSIELDIGDSGEVQPTVNQNTVDLLAEAEDDDDVPSFGSNGTRRSKLSEQNKNTILNVSTLALNIPNNITTPIIQPPTQAPTNPQLGNSVLQFKLPSPTKTPLNRSQIRMQQSQYSKKLDKSTLQLNVPGPTTSPAIKQSQLKMDTSQIQFNIPQQTTAPLINNSLNIRDSIENSFFEGAFGQPQKSQLLPSQSMEMSNQSLYLSQQLAQRIVSFKIDFDPNLKLEVQTTKQKLTKDINQDLLKHLQQYFDVQKDIQLPHIPPKLLQEHNDIVSEYLELLFGYLHSNFNQKLVEYMRKCPNSFTKQESGGFVSRTLEAGRAIYENLQGRQTATTNLEKLHRFLFIKIHTAKKVGQAGTDIASSMGITLEPSHMEGSKRVFQAYSLSLWLVSIEQGSKHLQLRKKQLGTDIKSRVQFDRLCRMAKQYNDRATKNTVKYQQLLKTALRTLFSSG